MPLAAPPLPPPAQIHRDVVRAARSKALWATVNICDTPLHPDVIGIRGQMPALGFPATLRMTFRLYYWSLSGYRFLPVPKTAKTISLGRASFGAVQGGVTFPFTPPVVLSGSITFKWYSGRKLLGTATRSTAHGIRGVDQADPRGHSAATCRIPA